MFSSFLWFVFLFIVDNKSKINIKLWLINISKNLFFFMIWIFKVRYGGYLKYKKKILIFLILGYGLFLFFEELNMVRYLLKVEVIEFKML